MTDAQSSKLITRLKRRLLCDGLNLHVGHAECIGGWMTFHCTRCGKHVHPISPEQTERITRKLYEEEGYDYDEFH